MRSTVFIRLMRYSRVVLLVLLSAYTLRAQRPAEKEEERASRNAIAKLQSQVRELEVALKAMQAESASYRAEMREIRRELRGTRRELTADLKDTEAVPVTYAALTYQAPASYVAGNVSNIRHESPQADGSAVDNPQQTGEAPSVRRLEEDYQLLAGKVDEQYQTKVESASKYRIRLSGLMLLNIFGNRGSVDNLDVPMTVLPRGALDSGGTFGATLRQTQLGLETFGPEVAGAKTSAALELDFAGGFPNAVNGVNYGIVRLRTATMRLDWARTSLVAGQDSLFFSPLAPTSLASVATPAFSWAGNIWAWVPQARIEQRLIFSETSRFNFQGGILDPQSGELPSGTYLRGAQAAEKSRQPGYAGRISWTYGPSERSLTVGAGGYYNRQNWGFGRNIDGWAGTLDASVPLGSKLSFTGAFYRGRAIGGLEGATGRTVVMSGALTERATVVQGLNTTGGWMQLKFEANRRLEFNAAVGIDNPFARDLRRFPVNPASRFAAIARDRSSFVNFIYRPRSDLLFSTEYRRMRTWDIRGGGRTGDHINVGMGILF